ALLTQRGIPFAERTVSSNDDIDALKRLSGEASLPLATIGAQQLKGFSDTEWTRYLDAAGYPKQSQLPPGYRRPAPAPMVAVVPKAAPAEPAAAPGSGEAGGNAPSAPARPGGPAPSKPAGIVFYRFARTSEGQRPLPLPRAEQAHARLVLGEDAHRHHARPLVYLGLESQRVGDRQARHVQQVLAVVRHQGRAV